MIGDNGTPMESWDESLSDSEEDEGSADKSESKSGDETDSKSGDAPTSRPSQPSRSARRTLGERVSKAREEPEGEAKPKARPSWKPKPKVAAKPKPKVGSKPKAAPKPKLKPKPKVESKPKREIHRPRRQEPGDEKADRDKRGRPDKSDRREGSSKLGSDEGRSRHGTPERDRKRKRDKPARKPIGPRVAAASGRLASSTKRRGVVAGKGIKSAVPRFGRLLLAGLCTIFGAFFAVLGFVLGILIAFGLVVARPIGFVLGKLSRLTNGVSRQVTPTRVLALVVAGAAVLLALSQYADFRSIAIGNDAYAGAVNVAPPPETGRLPTGDPNSYVFVPIAAICLLLLAGAVFFGRWRLLRLVTLTGLAAIVVALVVDRPAGLDLGDTSLAFDSVKATLLGGYYAQIAAGILLIVSSSLLAHELRLAGATAPARKRRGRRKSREPSRAAPAPPAPRNSGPPNRGVRNDDMLDASHPSG